MRRLGWYCSVSIWGSVGLLLSGCGGGGSSSAGSVGGTGGGGTTGPAITSVSVTPNVATIGTQVQFVATVSGTGSFSTSVTWSIAAPSGSALSAGTLTSSGLYTTPYPAPATVTVTATSVQDPTKSGAATVTLSQPAVAAGPTITVDAGTSTHAISPYIYGMNAYLLDGTSADADAVAKANISINRWGGDSTERYNYQLDVTSSLSDYFFENQGGTGGDGWLSVSGVSAFDALVQSNNAAGIKTLGTVNMTGWVAKNSTSCSYPVSTYANQQKVDSTGTCGNGIYPQGIQGCTNSNGCAITGNDPTVTSVVEPAPALPASGSAIGSSWTGNWVSAIVSEFGPGNPATGAGAGVSIYDLGNEPAWWDSEDQDVHPKPSTYDEVTQNGLATALAIKTADPTAEVSGPVVDYWWNYFYSKQDIEAGWGAGPCYEPWSNPADRTAHGGVPFLEYYLQQMNLAETKYDMRLLDYVDLHTYLAGTYNGNSVAFTAAGDTGVQQVRLNSTRAFWDPTYTDSNFPQPNYTTDSNYTAACATPAQAPQLIPMMQSWVAKDYPGTKLAIDEYNWGGMESINGAVAQADILGIFGAYGLDVGTLWPTSDPSGQIPGMMAFAMYRNYDGSNSRFGDMALSSTTSNQGTLAVYGALRSADNAVTVMVINKTYGDLTDTISLANVKATAPAKVFLYSNANLASIVAQAPASVNPPASGGTTSSVSATFPAQSITLLVVPQS